MALALFLRILIPTGFMPTVGSHGLVVDLCSGMDGKTVAIDLGNNAPVEKPHHAGDGPCVFATGVGHGLLASTELPAVVPFLFGVTIFVGTAIADLTINRLAAPPPPSRGPPALR